MKEAAKKAEQEPDFDDEPEDDGLASLMQLQEAAAVADTSESSDNDSQADNQDRISLGGMAALVAQTLCELENSPAKARRVTLEAATLPACMPIKSPGPNATNYSRLSKECINKIEGVTPPTSEKVDYRAMKYEHKALNLEGGESEDGDARSMALARGAVFSSRKKVFMDAGESAYPRKDANGESCSMTLNLQAEPGQDAVAGVPDRHSPPISPAPVSPPLLVPPSNPSACLLMLQLPIS